MSQTINLDTTPGLFMPTLHYSQGDIGRVFVINLESSDGFVIPAGATIKMVATKPSGLGFTVSGSLSGTVATFVTTETMTNEYGRFPAEIRIEKDGDVIGTANFILNGEKNPHPDNTTDGDAEELVNTITALVERVEAAVAKAEVLEESEAWAVGTRDGVPVLPTDPTYHNNSKYYAGQAETSKDNAATYASSAQSDKNAAKDYKDAAGESATAASNAKTAAQAAQAAAEAAAQDAQSVFQVAGGISASVDPETKKVTLYFTESE